MREKQQFAISPATSVASYSSSWLRTFKDGNQTRFSVLAVRSSIYKIDQFPALFSCIANCLEESVRLTFALHRRLRPGLGRMKAILPSRRRGARRDLNRFLQIEGRRARDGDFYGLRLCGKRIAQNHCDDKTTDSASLFHCESSSLDPDNKRNSAWPADHSNAPQVALRAAMPRTIDRSIRSPILIPIKRAAYICRAFLVKASRGCVFLAPFALSPQIFSPCT